MKLASGVVKDRSSYPTIEETDMNDENDVGGNEEKTNSTVNGTEVGKKSTQHLAHATPKEATPLQLEEILKHQKKEEELLKEQHELLQKKLLHDHDHYVKDLSSAQEKQVDLEIVNGDVNAKRAVPAQDSKKTVQPAPVGTYDLSAPEVIPSYSIMYSGPNTGKGFFLCRQEKMKGQRGRLPVQHLRICHAHESYF